MQTASLELSKELYALSLWDDTYFVWDVFSAEPVLRIREQEDPQDWNFAAYDLGCLLRKLPEKIDKSYLKDVVDYGLRLGPVSIVKPYKKRWAACYQFGGNVAIVNKSKLEFVFTTPEDAACRLAIELLNQGIIPTKEKEGVNR